MEASATTRGLNTAALEAEQEGRIGEAPHTFMGFALNTARNLIQIPVAAAELGIAGVELGGAVFRGEGVKAIKQVAEDVGTSVSKTAEAFAEDPVGTFGEALYERPVDVALTMAAGLGGLRKGLAGAGRALSSTSAVERAAAAARTAATEAASAGMDAAETVEYVKTARQMAEASAPPAAFAAAGRVLSGAAAVVSAAEQAVKGLIDFPSTTKAVVKGAVGLIPEEMASRVRIGGTTEDWPTRNYMRWLMLNPSERVTADLRAGIARAEGAAILSAEQAARLTEAIPEAARRAIENVAMDVQVHRRHVRTTWTLDGAETTPAEWVDASNPLAMKPEIVKAASEGRIVPTYEALDPEVPGIAEYVAAANEYGKPIRQHLVALGLRAVNAGFLTPETLTRNLDHYFRSFYEQHVRTPGFSWAAKAENIVEASEKTRRTIYRSMHAEQRAKAAEAAATEAEIAAVQQATPEAQTLAQAAREAAERARRAAGKAKGKSLAAAEQALEGEPEIPVKPAVGPGAVPVGAGLGLPRPLLRKSETISGGFAKRAVLKEELSLKEREALGHISDMHFSVVRGSAELEKDVALAELYYRLAGKEGYSRGEAAPGLMQMPLTAKVPKGEKARAIYSYGDLAGRWIPADDAIFLRRLHETPIAPGSLTKYWKWAMLAPQPGPGMRNVQSNLMWFMPLGDAAPWNPANFPHMRAASAETWRGGGPTVDMLKANGQWKTTSIQDLSPGEQYVARSLGKDLAGVFTAPTEAPKAIIESLWEALHAHTAAGWKGAAINAARGIRDSMRHFYDATSGLYSAGDDWARAVVLRKALAEGLSESEAIAKVVDAFPDYSDVPGLVEHMRSRWWGAPFITFTYKAFPRYTRWLAQHPVKAAALSAVNEMSNRIVAGVEGIPYEEWEKELAALPGYLYTGAFRLSEDTLVNLGYMSPAASIDPRPTGEYETGVSGVIGAGMRVAGLLGAPQYALAARVGEVAAGGPGHDIRTGREIISQLAPDEDRLTALMSETGNIMLPPLLFGYSYRKLKAAVQEKPFTSKGTQQTVPAAVLDVALGWRSYKLSAEERVAQMRAQLVAQALAERQIQAKTVRDTRKGILTEDEGREKNRNWHEEYLRQRGRLVDAIDRIEKSGAP